MDIIALVASSALVVTILTELVKAIPVAWTTKYPAWVNGILSVVASFIVLTPDFTFVSIGQTVVFAFTVAVLAGFSYNQYTSKLKKVSQ